ncbi:phage head closure protein [Microbulbifer sp. PSTR4-B]|uniref:phage head closure protein n=1 Tax=Microbulbifer sp. PSTR4-B TaxID=3243396 RepID=UPI00403942C6
MDKRIKVRLRDRVRFETSAETENEYGEKETTWSEYLTCSAEVMPLSASERVVSGQELSEAHYTIRIRSNSMTRSIHGQMRVIFDGHVLDISPPQKLQGLNQYLEFRAVQRSSEQ